jgi:hypothetical protein
MAPPDVAGAPVRIYTLYIEDDRYSVPTLLTAELVDDIRVIQHTRDILQKSNHYLAVDVWDGDRHVVRTEPDEPAA